MAADSKQAKDLARGDRLVCDDGRERTVARVDRGFARFGPNGIAGVIVTYTDGEWSQVLRDALVATA